MRDERARLAAGVVDQADHALDRIGAAVEESLRAQRRQALPIEEGARTLRRLTVPRAEDPLPALAHDAPSARGGLEQDRSRIAVAIARRPIVERDRVLDGLAAAEQAQA